MQGRLNERVEKMGWMKGRMMVGSERNWGILWGWIGGSIIIGIVTTNYCTVLFQDRSKLS